MNEIVNNKVNLCDSCSQVYPDCTSQPENVYFGDGVGHDNICACSEYQPETHEERTKTHDWIPVTERLPEDIRPVIVTWCNTDPASYYQYIVGKRFIGVAHYKSGKWYWYSSTTEDFLAEYGRYDGEEFDEAIEVLAWCEMPEPYKEGQR